ncbi:YtxH domain-containing protein [Cellulosimicrobium marinum]|uniref:YtxH domain-containing protein n=1 Tax=Cellulosimicrobium marinum TaxID=1638992 RepID=UPI001E514059|nr:YtxH domain-containing protein [Cellulosimicrobium marinum]MCB7135091.1 YtxH domain-containing protein [Cellulosimicrobium marinum]
MKAKIALLVGVGIGYVLGTRAGRERFEEIKVKAQDLWRSEDVQSAVHTAQEKVTAVAKEQGSRLADVAKEQGGKVAGAVKDQAASLRTGDPSSPDPVGPDDYRV